MLERVLAAGTFATTAVVGDAARARDIVLTSGTPSCSHIEIDMRDIRPQRADTRCYLDRGMPKKHNRIAPRSGPDVDAALNAVVVFSRPAELVASAARG